MKLNLLNKKKVPGIKPVVKPIKERLMSNEDVFDKVLTIYTGILTGALITYLIIQKTAGL